MDRDRGLSLRVGAFVVAALAALAAIVLSLSAEQGLFRARYPLVAYFENVQGLVAGANAALGCAERAVLRTGHLARGHHDPVEHGVQLEVGADGHHRVEQGPRVVGQVRPGHVVRLVAPGQPFSRRPVSERQVRRM